MENILNEIVIFINSLGVYGGVLSCLIILIESMIPVIPLMVFITLNFYIFGTSIGFILSWIFTICGCLLSYSLFKYGFGDKFDYLTKEKDKLNKYKNAIKNLSLTQLILIIAVPFTPAFLVNIVCGLLKIDFKKYFIAILIGKISLVYFWGFVGTSLLDIIKQPIILIRVSIILIIMYIISKVITKIVKI